MKEKFSEDTDNSGDKEI